MFTWAESLVPLHRLQETGCCDVHPPAALGEARPTWHVNVPDVPLAERADVERPVRRAPSFRCKNLGSAIRKEDVKAILHEVVPDVEPGTVWSQLPGRRRTVGVSFRGAYAHAVVSELHGTTVYDVVGIYCAHLHVTLPYCRRGLFVCFRFGGRC